MLGYNFIFFDIHFWYSQIYGESNGMSGPKGDFPNPQLGLEDLSMAGQGLGKVETSW